MAVMPLYPGYQRAKDADAPSRVVRALEREPAVDRHATQQGEIIRRDRARAIDALVKERRQWQGIERSRRAEALRLLQEGEVPAWVSEAIRAAQSEIRRVNRKLDPLRAEAWVQYDDAFIEEPRPVMEGLCSR